MVVPQDATESLATLDLTGLLLPAIDPAGEDEEQQVPWLKLGLYVPPDTRFTSGIVGFLSRVAPSVTSARGKIRRHNRLRLG